MKLLLDENLSRRVIPAILDAYPESSQIALLGMDAANDKQVWAYAQQNGYILVTQDSDFHEMSVLYGHPLNYRVWKYTLNTVDNAERRINAFVSTGAKLALTRLAARYAVTEREMLQRLIMDTEAELTDGMTDRKSADHP